MSRCASYLAILTACYWFAYALRFDFQIPGSVRMLMWATLPWVAGVKLLAFLTGRGFYGWLRQVTFADLADLLRSCTLGTLAIIGIDFFLVTDHQIPRAVVLLDWGLTIVILGGLRSTWRLAREHFWTHWADRSRCSAFLIGVDGGGEALCRQIHNNHKLNLRIVGFLDHDRRRYGSYLGGVPILGGPHEATRLAARHGVRDILVIANSLSGRQLRELNNQCKKAQIRVKMIPSIDHLCNGSFDLQVRDVDITDLLHREPVDLESSTVADMVVGKRVMVTGAGGSIGSEICRQLSTSNPQQLILVERAENSLFEIDQELARIAPRLVRHACIADICDESRMRSLFQLHRPQLVFHAAAHKHVPLMESNPGEAIANNLFGTKTVADVADHFGVERFVLISTDKAVNPSSVMGTSKHLAERYLLALSQSSATNYIVVRFGNVLGSTGSVVPIFREQIRRGGPITITHPEMQRFFMTIPEASQLVLQAAALGQGGEIFVLDMGEPVKIVDLAKDLIRLSGLSPDDIEMTVVGPRPGEKLSEEVFRKEEQTLPTCHPKLRIARPQTHSLPEVRQWLASLAPHLNGSGDAIRQRLRQLDGGCAEPADLGQVTGATHNHHSGNGNHHRGNGNRRKPGMIEDESLIREQG